MHKPEIDNLTIVGEFELDYLEQTLAKLPCQVSEDATLSLLLQTKSGVIRLKRKFNVLKGWSVLELKFPRLASGTYDAWIEVEGKTFIRHLVVPGSLQTNLLDKIKNLFDR
jgi:hypothetical protein